MSPKRVSIVIPTFNRRERLARVLASLERQTAAPDVFEVVVVDDGSSDGTSEWLPSHRTAFSLVPLRVPNGGPAKARNAGVAAAQGDVVLFIDDDVEASPELVDEHLRSHDADADVVVIGPLASLSHYPQPWVAWEQAKIEAQYAAMARGDWAPTFRQFWTGNASLERRHLLAAGGFDTTYLRGEDVELGARLDERGIGFRFNPRAKVVHHAERSLASWERAHASYGRLEVAIFGRAGDRALIETLSGNWNRLNPATRWVVQSCLGRKQRGDAVKALLRAHIKLAERAPLTLGAGKACSVLANLWYWEHSVEALGPERAAQVLGGRRVQP